MSYDLEKMHEIKSRERRSGRTVDALVDVIGKIMVTENEVIPFVVKYMDRVRLKLPEFNRLCREHFGVRSKMLSQFEFGIEGYSSYVRFISVDLWETQKLRRFNPDIEPTYDLD
jgi:hypothetical protein